MLYRIPVVQRIIDEGKGDTIVFLEIDGIGYKVINHLPGDLNKEKLKKKPSIIKVSDFFVFANTPKEAIYSFFDNCFGANFGLSLKAYKIGKKIPIIEIDCPRINQNGPGELICGKEVIEMPTKSGTFGFCALSKNAFPQSCDIVKKIIEIDQNKNYPKECIEVEETEYGVAKIKIY